MHPEWGFECALGLAGCVASGAGSRSARELLRRLPSRFAAGPLSNLMRCEPCQRPEEGKGRLGEDRASPVPLKAACILEKREVVCWKPKITVERQLECCWEGSSTKDQQSGFSSFAAFKVT